MGQIQSQRAQLRRFEMTDLDHLIELETDPEILKFITDGKVYSHEEVKERLIKLISENNQLEPLGVWAAEDKNTGELIGWFMLRYYDRFVEPELGFMIRKKFWGQGLTKEICKSIVDFAITDLGIRKIVAITHADNYASIKILEGINFEFDRVTMIKSKTLNKLVPANLYVLEV